MPTEKTPWTAKYIIVYRGETARHIRAVESNLSEYGECRVVGYRTYTIRDKTARITAFVAIASYRECERFANQMYHALKENKWKPISLEL